MHEKGSRTNSCVDMRVHKTVASDGYLSVCSIQGRRSLAVGTMDRPGDTPAERGGKLAHLALKCSAALAAHTVFKNKGVAANRFCCLIITSVLIYFMKVP